MCASASERASWEDYRGFLCLVVLHLSSCMSMVQSTFLRVSVWGGKVNALAVLHNNNTNNNKIDKGEKLKINV